MSSDVEELVWGNFALNLHNNEIFLFASVLSLYKDAQKYISKSSTFTKLCL